MRLAGLGLGAACGKERNGRGKQNGTQNGTNVRTHF
jgi:hypothetical protein